MKKIKNYKMMAMIGVMMTIIILALSYTPVTKINAADSTNAQMGPFVNPTGGPPPAGIPVIKDQYLKVDVNSLNKSPNNQAWSATQGQPNTQIMCGTNEQLNGIHEHSSGINSTAFMQAVYGNVMPRVDQYLGNYRYIPRCDSFNTWTDSCNTQDWITEYDIQDALNLECAPNSYLWETKGANPNPNTPSNIWNPI